MSRESKGALLAAEISKNGAGKASPAHSNLFVGNIASTVTEEDLTAAFAPFGEIDTVVLSIKPGRPSGFVRMQKVDDASKAADALNGKDSWVVKFANYDVGQAPKYSQKGKGFSDGSYWFPPFFDWSKGFGAGCGKGGYSKGFGKSFSGKGYGGWTFVKGGGNGFFKGGVPELREDAPERPEPPESDNIYVKHLPLGVTEENVKDTFSCCGDIAEVRLLRPDFALECAALVRFAKKEDAEKARTTLDATVVKGSTPPIYANVQNQGGNAKQDHVYIKGLPTNASEDKLKDLIGKHGEVKWSKVMRTSPNQSRIAATCAALFEMGSEAEAQAVISALNNTTLTFEQVAPAMRVRYAENKAAKATAAREEAATKAEEDMSQMPPETRLAAAPPPPPPEGS